MAKKSKPKTRRRITKAKVRRYYKKASPFVNKFVIPFVSGGVIPAISDIAQPLAQKLPGGQYSDELAGWLVCEVGKKVIKNKEVRKVLNKVQDGYVFFVGMQMLGQPARNLVAQAKSGLNMNSSTGITNKQLW